MFIIKKVYTSVHDYTFDIVGYVASEDSARNYVEKKNKENKEGSAKIAVINKKYSDWKLLNPMPIVVKGKNDSAAKNKIEELSEKWLKEHKVQLDLQKQGMIGLEEFADDINYQYEEIKKLD